MKPFSYTNKYGAIYYLHIARGSDSRPYHAMSTHAEAAESRLPRGFEVRETVNAQVAVRRVRAKQISPLEEQLLRVAMKNLRPFAYLLDVDGKAATVYRLISNSRTYETSSRK